jgi:hypothetical protein
MLRRILSTFLILSVAIPQAAGAKFMPQPNPAPSGTGGTGTRLICRYDPNREPCTLTTFPDFAQSAQDAKAHRGSGRKAP